MVYDSSLGKKTTRPFLRSREILWQEGHTLHATSEEAMAETLRMLHVYEDFQRNHLAMPVIVGRKNRKKKNLLELKQPIQLKQ